MAVEDSVLYWTAAYNGDGVRLQTEMSIGLGPLRTTRYVVDAAAPLPVVLQAQTATTTTTYLYSLGTRPLAAVRNAGAWEYLLPDALGSVRQIADANGNVTLAKSYEPYGNLLSSDGSASSRYGFTGEERDSYINLYEMGARWYSPYLSRQPNCNSLFATASQGVAWPESSSQCRGPGKLPGIFEDAGGAV